MYPIHWTKLYILIILYQFHLLGFITDQREYEIQMNNKTHPPNHKTGPGMAEPVERFKLNNLSFAGPVIMGIGGKIH